MFGSLGKKLEKQVADHYRESVITALQRSGRAYVEGVGTLTFTIGGGYNFEPDLAFDQEVRRTNKR